MWHYPDKVEEALSGERGTSALELSEVEQLKAELRWM